MEKQLGLFDIDADFVSGRDWQTFSNETINSNVHPRYIARSKKFYRPEIRGILACWLSHRDVWDLASHSNEEVIAVFEDDAGFTPDTKAAIEALDEFSRTRGGVRHCISLQREAS